jgi:tripartite-type tricarboxylate transporter receptor subunit TctC
MFAPAKTPKYMVEKMNMAMSQVLGSEDIQEKFKSLDLIIVGGSISQTVEYIQSELNRWDAVFKYNASHKN